ncbi:MAG TPA: GNAT family N-acetyltransferase [Tepidisphaeraceae bacterium]|nr:GNAT family N-acetyltransferase [Tepidisphaeraceae bacterium]
MNRNGSQSERAGAAGGELLLPVRPRVNVAVRAGTPADVAFMDALQKQTTRQVGWVPTKQIEGKVAAGHVLVAEVVAGCKLQVASEGAATGDVSPLATSNSQPATYSPAGYLIGHDQYFKRDDVGVIYQINVIPEYRRSLVAATLLQAQFGRSAYGCKLYCCWCAQDLDANRFWESMGFVPLAFRTGGVGRKVARADNGGPSSLATGNRPLATHSRTHIFWQKRIRAGDVTTPWWFPSQTSGGSIREDRIVLPIPPGTHWSDAKPIVLPGEPLPVASGQLPVKQEKRSGRAGAEGSPPPATPRRINIARCGLRIGPAAAAVAVAAEKPGAAKRPKRKNDPKLVAAARELRDRWLEEVNAGRYLPAARGRYDVTRVLAADAAVADAARPLPSSQAA